MRTISKTRWTEEQLNLVRELYPHGDVSAIVERTGRSRQSVVHKAIELGLSGKYHWRGTPSPIGTEIRRRGKFAYVMVKTLDDAGKAVWMRKHHIVWRENTGTLPPKGMRVIFKDGDRNNCAFDNLELIPDAESAHRMTRLRAYPPALQETIRLLTTVRNALNEHQDHRRRPRSPVQAAGPALRPREDTRL